MILISYLKQQCRMWCSLPMFLSTFNTRKTAVPTPELHNQKYTWKHKKMFRGKPPRLSKFWKIRPLRKGQKIGIFSAWGTISRWSVGIFSYFIHRTIDKHFYLSPLKTCKRRKGWRWNKRFRLERRKVGWRGLSTIGKGHLVSF